MTNPIGRPSKYRPEYCEMVIAAAREGKSLTNFASDIDVARSTINEWMGEHPAFSEAVARAKHHAASWYEARARRLVEEGGGGAQASMIQFAMKNLDPDGWRDRITQEVTGANGGPVAFVLRDMTKRE